MIFALEIHIKTQYKIQNTKYIAQFAYDLVTMDI